MSAIGNRIKGTLKEIEGKVTGDKVRMAEGKVQETAGKVVGAVKDGVRRVKAAVAKKAVTTKAGRKAMAAKITP